MLHTVKKLIVKKDDFIKLLSAHIRFDEEFYLLQHPDVRAGNIEPKKHFQIHGWREHRQPSGDFDPISYLSAHPDVVLSGGNAFKHAIANVGNSKSIQYPSSDTGANSADYRRMLALGLFDEDYYRANYPEVKLDVEAAIHFITIGSKRGWNSTKHFHADYYRLMNAEILDGMQAPFLHYLRSGPTKNDAYTPPFGASTTEIENAEAEILSSGLFDQEFYLSNTPICNSSEVPPIRHYLLYGHLRYQSTSAQFDAIDYLARTPSARRSALPPLIHYLRQSETGNKNTETQWSAECYSRNGWQTQPDELPKPDCNINIERMRGVRFLSGFGYGWEGEISTGRYAEAIKLLSKRTPTLVSTKTDISVSIVIPVYGQLAFILNCLDSLSMHNSRFNAEIIVVDDASPDETNTASLAEIPWIRYERREKNSGFIASCNFGASIAAGNYLVFLNSDTRMGLGWLDEIIGSFDVFPKAGLVGSKLYNTDGTLQEAGGIYWRNGNAWNYGRDQSSSDPKFCFSRQVDYCSGASIAVKKSVFEEAGCFNSDYTPAYCEDSDLAFTLRELGYEIWFQALSRVIHYEGKSHGRDLTKGGKAYQVRNMQQFAEKWSHLLGAYRPEGVEVDREANRQSTKHILVVDAVTPTPDRDSGSIITVQMIRALRELGWNISFVPQHNYLYSGKYTDELQRLGVQCFYAPFVGGIDAVLERIGPVDVVLVYRFNVLAPIIDVLRNKMPFARIVFHNVDLHYLREQREAELQQNRQRRIEASRVHTDEISLMVRSDAVIVHTAVEKVIIEKQVPISHVVEFPYIANVHKSQTPFEARHDITFLGGFAHTPNIDAMLFFVNEVWPLLTQSLPAEACLRIVGSQPPSDILQFAGERIVITGYVPDLVPIFDASRVFVAPLRYGAGIKGKVVQSLAHGVPSVCTPIAAEGMGLISDETTVIATTPAEIADAVTRLYKNRDLWRNMQIAGYEFVERNYSWSRSLELCKKFLDVADETWIRREEFRRTKLLNALVEELGPS